MNQQIQTYTDFIPERIRYMREDAKLSYKELSKLTGVSVKHLKKFETSDFSKLPATELAYICEVFSISIDSLYQQMSFENFKENYQPLKQFGKLSPDMQNAFLETMREVPLKTHTDEEFIETLFRKVANGDEEAYQKHLTNFYKAFRGETSIL